MVVEELMRTKNIDISQPTSDGITPLCQACNMGHAHVVELFMRVAGLNEKKDGATALTSAASKRQTRIVDMTQNMKNNILSSKTAASKYEIQP